MADATACAFLYVETALHAGTAKPGRAIDMPTQRDEAGTPIVPASALRGSVLAAAKRVRGSDEITWAFGSAPGREPQQEGVLSFAECRPLLLPVRTYKGIFAWITCPSVFSAWQTAAQSHGCDVASPELPTPGEHEAIVAPQAPMLTAHGTLIIEDFSFPARQSDELSALSGWLVQRAFPAEAGYDWFRRRLGSSVVLLPDDAYGFFLQHRLPVTRRTAIDPTTGTAAEGTLWSEEYLPPESMLYTFVEAEHRGGVPPVPVGGVTWLRQLDLQRFQVGANRTLGGGVVRWIWLVED